MFFFLFRLGLMMLEVQMESLKFLSLFLKLFCFFATTEGGCLFLFFWVHNIVFRIIYLEVQMNLPGSCL